MIAALPAVARIAAPIVIEAAAESGAVVRTAALLRGFLTYFAKHPELAFAIMPVLEKYLPHPTAFRTSHDVGSFDREAYSTVIRSDGALIQEAKPLTGNIFAATEANFNKGVIFRSDELIVELADMPKGTHGFIRTDINPMRVMINAKDHPSRASLTLAHELMHYVDEVLKLQLPHNAVHFIAREILRTLQPALRALDSASKRD